MSSPNPTYERLLQIWEKQFGSNGNARMPLVPAPVHPAPLLFVGLNPSFGKDGFRRLLHKTPYERVNASRFFKWKNREQFDPQVAQEIEKIAKAKHPYFKPLKDIADSLEVEWEHVDLFFYRETGQNRVKKLVWEDDDVLTEFGRAQVELARQLMAQVDPKVIVVVNALASRILERELQATFDEDKGYHTLCLKTNRIPAFFGSMLSGQRALDTYSRQRLQWHIKRALESANGIGE